jgi:triacylglycerol lipase
MRIIQGLFIAGFLMACSPSSPGEEGPEHTKNNNRNAPDALITILSFEDPPTNDEKTQTPISPTEIGEKERDENLNPPPCTTEIQGELPLSTEGMFLPQGDTVEGQRERCFSVQHAVAGAAGSSLEITLSQWNGTHGANLSVYNLKEELIAATTTIGQGESLVVSTEQSGEMLVRITPVDPNETNNDYAISAQCFDGCDLEYTRYPAIFLHGLAGGTHFGTADYFSGLRAFLEPLGYLVLTPEVLPFAATQERAIQWESHLEEFVEKGVGRKFNLIGHSQGGLDARYLVSGLERGELVSSVITVGTPHRGTPIATLFFGMVEDGPIDEVWVDIGASAFALLFGLKSDNNSLVAAMEALTPETLESFNMEILDDENVYYASWAGVTCGSLDNECKTHCHGETVTPLLGITHFILSLYGESNDGIVTTSSAQWGDFQGEVCADHADLIGHLSSHPINHFDPLSFYHEEMQRLATRGL